MQSEVIPRRAPGLSHGWFTDRCLVCGRPVGVIVPGRQDIRHYKAELEGAHVFRLSGVAHDSCMHTCPNELLEVLKIRALSHQLFEAVAALN